MLKITEMLNTASDVLTTNNLLITEGKRKGEGTAPAVSLQDVFSDSENLPVGHQKTLLPSENGRNKLGATSEK